MRCGVTFLTNGLRVGLSLPDANSAWRIWAQFVTISIDFQRPVFWIVGRDAKRYLMQPVLESQSFCTFGVLISDSNRARFKF
jgi:hypothetical protein